MPEAANEILVERPREDVFAFLGDAENDKAWRSGVLEIERVSGTGVGTRYRQRMKGPGGRAVPADIEITEFRPHETIAFAATAGPVRPRGRYVLTPAGAGATRVRFELEAELRGLKRLMARTVQKTMEREVGALANLKRVLEQRAGA